MANSPLVSYTRLDPDRTPRKYPITRITPHCVVGQWSAKKIVDYLATTDRKSHPSVNYGVGCDGKVALGVPENYKSNCSSSGDNDHRAVTIECASDTTPPYAFRDITYKTLIDLCVDICKRNGKKKLLWFGNKQKTLNYTPKSDEMVLTVHRWFDSAKACPGDFLMSRMTELATTVTARLNNEELKPKEDEIDMTKDDVQKMIDDSIRKAIKGKDLPVSDWFVEEWEKAKKAEITDGSRPQGLAKREEVAAMILRATRKEGD